MHSGYKSHKEKHIPEHVDSDGSPLQNDNKNHRKKIVDVCIVCVSKSLSNFWTRHPGTHTIFILHVAVFIFLQFEIAMFDFFYSFSHVHAFAHPSF